MSHFTQQEARRARRAALPQNAARQARKTAPAAMYAVAAATSARLIARDARLAFEASELQGIRPYDCPGCNGEASKNVGVMLGCPVCPL